MKELLDSKHLNFVNKRNEIEKCLNRIKWSYNFIREYTGNDWGYVKFNGISKLTISFKDGVFTVSLSGFGLRHAPSASLTSCSGCSDIGIIEKTSDELNSDVLVWIVNNLAEYENIYPIK